MATNLQLLKHALKSNNNDLMLVRRLFKEALDILEGSSAFKQVTSASYSADLLSLSQSQWETQRASPGAGPFTSRVTPSTCVSHGTSRITVGHLTKSCVELIHQ